MTASDKLVAALALGAHDGAAVHNPSNMFYLTQGYTGEGVVFISAGRRVIVTDFRYTEQAEKQAPGFQVVMTDKTVSHGQWIGRLCAEEGVHTLRYEDDYLTVKAFEDLKLGVGGDVSFLPMNQAPESSGRSRPPPRPTRSATPAASPAKRSTRSSPRSTRA